MIGYLDTSAFVPLLVGESTSGLCRRFWNDADAVVTCRLTYVETVAALSRANRLDRLTSTEYDASRELLERLWGEIDVVEVDDVTVRHAADLAARYGLRGYDAVHCACADQLHDADVVAAAGDRQLIDAWIRLGIAVFDPNNSSPE